MIHNKLDLCDFGRETQQRVIHLLICSGAALFLRVTCRIGGGLLRAFLLQPAGCEVRSILCLHADSERIVFFLFEFAMHLG